MTARKTANSEEDSQFSHLGKPVGLEKINDLGDGLPLPVLVVQRAPVLHHLGAHERTATLMP